jgi:Ca-activated chloride channel family protein
MSIAYPWLLLLYIPFAVLLVYVFRKVAPSIKIPSIIPFQKSAGKGKFKLSRIPLLIYIIAVGLLIFALARPRKGIEHIMQRAEGIDIMLAIDLSGSMKAIDVPGHINTENELREALQNGKVKDRLETAKQEIKRFVEKRPNDRIGLIGFAPKPYTVCPPTLDHGWLLEHLKHLKPGIIGEYTGIAGPIASAVHRLKDADSKRRVVVLFTDGRNNIEAKITPRQAAKLAKTFNVVIYTVGIGSNSAYMLSHNSFFGSRFQPVSGDFDEPLLKDIASDSEGKYYKAADAEGMRKVMEEINKMEKTSSEQPKIINYKEWAPRLAVIAGVLLMLGFMLENTVFASIP